MKNKLIDFVEKKYFKKDIPILKSGYLIEIKLWIIESSKKRLQTFKGVIISVKNKGLNSSFILRKLSYGEGVERLFLIHSPLIYSILIVKKFFFNKSKLYFLRKKKKNFYVK